MKKFFSFLFLFCIVYVVNAQEYQSKQTTVFLYSFENLSSQEQADNVIASVLKVPGITEAKVNCKWESNRGELIFKVEEILSGNENSENLNIAPVKAILIENNLTPIDCTIRLPR